MFTGIVEELGVVKALEKKGAIYRLQVAATRTASGTKAGQSVCVNGVCLTVVKAEKDLLCFEVMQETLNRTNLGLLKPVDKVNLERALRVDARLDGHFVSGHIDETGVISRSLAKGSDISITVDSSPNLLRYIVLRGSVSLDGVSLTVSAVEEASFSVNFIPYTLKNTTLGWKKQGSTVNIECDILAKYIAKSRLLKPTATSKISPAFLQEQGFI